MTREEMFYKFFEGGNFSCHYLLKFELGNSVIRLCDNNKDIVFDGETYLATSLEFTPPDTTGAGASLKITLIENFDLFSMLASATDNYTLSVVGVINESGTVEEYESSNHMYGSLSVTQDRVMQFTLDRDDRLEMQFCVYDFDSENNRAGV